MCIAKNAHTATSFSIVKLIQNEYKEEWMTCFDNKILFSPLERNLNFKASDICIMLNN